MNRPLFNADAAEEYFTNRCIYYRDLRNDTFKKDNEGRHVTEQTYSSEYQKFLGMELGLREVLEYFSKFDLGPADSEKPLELEELKGMIGSPVWIVSKRISEWVIVHSYHHPEVCGRSFIMTRRTAEKRQYPFSDYGETWLAYRRPPHTGQGAGEHQS